MPALTIQDRRFIADQSPKGTQVVEHGWRPLTKLEYALPTFSTRATTHGAARNSSTYTRLDMRNVDVALLHSHAPSTNRKYGYAVDRFLQFCDTFNIPNQDRLPASEAVLCVFASSHIGKQSGSTARNYISGLKAWHIHKGRLWLGGPKLAKVLKGVNALTPKSSVRPPRVAVTVDMLVRLVTSLDILDPEDAAIAAIATTAFWGQARLGELLPETTDHVAADLAIYFPSRSHLGPLSTTRKSRTLHLPFTKVKQRRGEDVVITNQSGLANPLPILANHLQINSPPTDSPLFSIRAQGHSRRLITKKHFLHRCNAFWGTAGFKRITGHCFRIGGTTELLTAGVAPDVVKKMGRWASDSFLRYWRDLEGVGEYHVANVRQKQSKR